MNSSINLVSVIIPTTGRREVLLKCLHSLKLQSYSYVEVIVVCNNCPSDLYSCVKRISSQVKIIDSDTSFYGANLNKGIVCSRGKYILCLNDDVILDKDFIKNALKGFSKDKLIGMVSGKILRMNGRIIDTTGLYVDLFGRARERGYNKKVHLNSFSKEGYIFGVSGCASFLKRELLDEMKEVFSYYFDPSFGFFYEDLDFCWRAQNLGWKGYYVPQAIAYHCRGETIRNKKTGACKRKFARSFLNYRYHFYLIRNRYITLIKNEKMWRLILFLPFIVAYDLVVLIYILLNCPKFLLYFRRRLKEFLRDLKNIYKWRKWFLREMKRKQRLTFFS